MPASSWHDAVMPAWLLFFIVPLVFGLWAQHWVKSSFAKWSQVPANSGTGADVAARILAANGLSAGVGSAGGGRSVVSISITPGQLSDHYDPRDRSLHLSQDVGQATSVASVAVAAHEVGHALQHAKGSAFFSFRSVLARPVAIASQLWYLPLLGGIFLRQTNWIAFALILYALVVLFHVVTLPVELDASRRALKQLDSLGITSDPQVKAGARNVLSAAAMTYVAAALASLAQLAYFALAFLGNRN
jgi:Zn-dependent membrane protease YugP